MDYIILILIIIIILLLLVICLYFSNNIESFSDNNDWPSTWSDLDSKARNNANCEPIKKEWITLGNISTWIWTVPDSCEQGLPHTRDKDIIAMPESYSGDYNRTIEHEKIHLYQRRDPQKWINFYKDNWNYEIFSNPPEFMPKELIQKRRANPDISIHPWCRWRNRWWSVPIYNDINNLSLSRAPIMWYDEKENKILENPPAEWLDFFGKNVSQIEHPHEISAVLLSEKSLKNNLTHASKILLNKLNLF